MNKIKLNNAEFEIDSYNRSTYFSGETITSNAGFSLVGGDITALNDLAETPIISIQIYHDDNLIYNLQNIEAHFDNINEYLSTDHMNTNVNLIFDIV